MNILTDKKSNRIATINADRKLAMLFVYSIFFRCSIAGYHGFNLRSLERKLRKVLYKYLDDRVEKIRQLLDDDPPGFPDLPVVATFFENNPSDDPTTNFVTVLHSDRPYCVYLNDMTFQLFTKEKHISNSKEFFFSITDMLSAKQSANTSNNQFKVTLLTEGQLKKVLTTVFESASNRQMKFFQKAFREVHKAIFNTLPSDELVAYFIQLLITQKAPPGERYGQQYFALAIYNACKLWYQIP